jgi:hypothetical protein
MAQQWCRHGYSGGEAEQLSCAGRDACLHGELLGEDEGLQLPLNDARVLTATTEEGKLCQL